MSLAAPRKTLQPFSGEEAEAQKLTDQFIKQIDELQKKKDAELLPQ